MTLPVHVVGGFFLTGVAGALSGVSIVEPLGIAVTVVGSVLPDIDHTKSPVGRIVPPLSRWLNRRHGHRNLTHSAVFTAVLCLVLAVIESSITGQSHYTLIFGLAYSSHILLDMFTLHGVGLFYPFVRNMAVLPGNAKYRVKTGNPRTEAGIFVGFCIVSIGALPLIQQGFWTSYNRTFSTPMHLVSEFEKSTDLLEATYTVRRGSAEETGKGFVVDPGPDRIVLVRDGRFRVINGAKEKVVSITPEHTGREIWFESVAFSELPGDSLAGLTAGQLILKGAVTGNREFVAMGEERKSWKFDYLVGLRVKDGYRESEFVEPEYQEPPRVFTILQRINRINQEGLRRSAERAAIVARASALQSEIQATKDMRKRQRLQNEYNALSIPPVYDQFEATAQLRAEAKEVQERARLEHEEKVREAREKWEAEKPGPLLLSGYIEYVRFSDPKPKTVI